MKTETKHECDPSEIEWGEDLRYGHEDVYYLGRCPVCGKEFHDVYVPKGIWDTEKKEWIYTVI